LDALKKFIQLVWVMFQKSLTLSLLANLSIGAALSGGVVKAEVQPQGQIEFTADNASEVFLNGTSLGSSSNWQAEPIKLPVKSQLKQGKKCHRCGRLGL
jgi:hypothetical protein